MPAAEGRPDGLLLNRLDVLHRRVVQPEVGDRVSQAVRIEPKVVHVEANGQRGERLPYRRDHTAGVCPSNGRENEGDAGR